MKDSYNAASSNYENYEVNYKNSSTKKFNFSLNLNLFKNLNFENKSFYEKWQWLLPVYMFLVINSGSIYWGWAGGFREMFFKMEAYDWVSDTSSPNRDTQIGYLLTVANISNLICDGIVGSFLDYFGPRYTLLFGILIRFLGWLLIGFSSESLQLYILGMILIGGSTDFIYFPFCSYGTIFEKKKGLVISLLGASMSFSSIVPIVIYEIWSNFFSSWSSSLYLSIYASGWLVMMTISAFFFIPVKGFRETIISSIAPINHLNEIAIDTSEETSNTSKISNNEFSLKTWFKPLLKPSFLFIIPIGCLLILRSEYAQRNLFKDIPLTYDFWIIISPLRFLPCAIMGEISDRFGHIKTLFVFEGIAAILFLSNYFTGMLADSISTICIFIFSSWIMTSQYVYITKTQPSAEFGRLSGSIAVIAGAFLFFNVLIAPLTETEQGSNIVRGVMLSLSLVNGLILLSSYYFNYRINWVSIPLRKK